MSWFKIAAYAFMGVNAIRNSLRAVKSPTYDTVELANTGMQSLPVPIVYGTCEVAGNIIYLPDRYYSTGTTGEWTRSNYLVALCEGEVNDISDVYYNGNVLKNPSTSDLPVGDDAAYTEAYSITWRRYFGTSTQLVDPIVETLSAVQTYTTLTSTERAAIVGGLRYTAYLACADNQKNQPADMPRITCTVEGMNISTYDGSSWSTNFSNNPAYIIRDFLTNERYGVGLASTRINAQSFIDAAAVCDVDVTDIAGTGTENRFELDYVIDRRRPVIDTLDDMLASFGGFLLDVDGEINLRIEKEESLGSVQSFGMDSIIADSFSFRKLPLESTPNRIKLVYTQADGDTREAYVIAEDAANIATRGIVEQVITLYGIKREGQASRMAWQLLEMARLNDTMCQFAASINDIQSQCGDIIKITHTMSGWVDKTFRIVGIEELPDDNMQILCLEYNANLFTDSHCSVAVDINYAQTYNPYYKPDAPTSFSLITSYSDLSAYPLSLRREVMTEIVNYYDSDSAAAMLAPVILTDFVVPTGHVRSIECKSVLPLEKSSTQLTGTCTSDGVNKITIAGVNWVTLYGGSYIRQHLVTFSGSTTSGGREHIIKHYELSGADTVVTLSVENGVPYTGRYFIIGTSDSDIPIPIDVPIT